MKPSPTSNSSTILTGDNSFTEEELALTRAPNNYVPFQMSGIQYFPDDDDSTSPVPVDTGLLRNCLEAHGIQVLAPTIHMRSSKYENGVPVTIEFMAKTNGLPFVCDLFDKPFGIPTAMPDVPEGLPSKLGQSTKRHALVPRKGIDVD